MAKPRNIAKSEHVERNLEAGLAKLATAANAGAKALAVRARDSKKVALAVKRLAKRRAALLRRKKVASKRAKRLPGGETKKALRAVVRELVGTTKQLGKARAAKAAQAIELAALKLASRRASGYARAIAAVDRVVRRAK